MSNRKQIIASRKYYRPKNKLKRKFYFCLSIIIFLFGLTIFTTHTNYFKIKKISVSIISPNQIQFIKKAEIKKIIDEQIKESSILFPQNNIFAFSKNKLKRRLEKDPRIKEIKVLKKIPNQIRVVITEDKIAALLIVYGGKNYFLNDKGIIISSFNKEKYFTTQDSLQNSINSLIINQNPSQINSDNQSQNRSFYNFPVIYDQTNFSYQSPEMRRNILFALKLTKLGFLNNKIHFENIKITKKQGVTTIEALSNRNWLAYFLPFTDPEIKNTFDSQVRNLDLALQKIGDSKIKYIDLRFGNYLYYQ